MRSLSIAATGMLAQQLNVDVIANNISNMSTTAFKRQRAEFQDLLYQNLRRVGSPSSDSGTIVPSGVQLGVGVKPTAVYRISEQGSLTKTDNALDLAINGRGYFAVDLPTGETGYTRAGSFQTNAAGDLVTADGYVVQPGINIPADATTITVNVSGEIIVTQDGQVGSQTVGQISLVTFPNDAGLEAIGNNLLLETAASGGAATATPGAPGFGTIEQGALETSNVDVVSEMTNLITAQRAYEMNSRVIQASDEMMQSVSQLR